jgi:D-alanine transaminase
MEIYLNGQFQNLETACISVTDRGFIFGDGIYEVIRVVGGSLFREKDHLERLKEGLEGIGIHPGKAQFEQLPEICRDLLKRNEMMEGEAVIYIQITRGASWPRTHTFPKPEVSPTVYINTSTFHPYKELHSKGAKAITESDVRWTRCNLKTTQLLPNTLSRERANNAGADNVILIRDGMVTESPNANIYAVKNGVLYTYPASNYILSGITRKVVLEIATRLQISVKEIPISETDLFNLDELFLTGTTTDIMPITMVNEKEISNGKPGPIVRKIQQVYNKMLYYQNQGNKESA